MDDLAQLLALDPTNPELIALKSEYDALMALEASAGAGDGEPSLSSQLRIGTTVAVATLWNSHYVLLPCNIVARSVEEDIEYAEIKTWNEAESKVARLDTLLDLDVAALVEGINVGADVLVRSRSNDQLVRGTVEEIAGTSYSVRVYDNVMRITRESIFPYIDCGSSGQNIAAEDSDDDDGSMVRRCKRSIDEAEGSDDEEEADQQDTIMAWPNSATTSVPWQTYTKDTALRYMARMGYVEGQSLGLTGDGITDPIEVEILPTGRGLGFLEEKKNKRQKTNAVKAAAPQEPTVFDFMNRSLGSKQRAAPSRTLEKSADVPAVSDATNGKTPHDKESVSRIELIKLSNKMAAIDAEIEKTRASMSRNKKDKAMTEVLTGRMEKLLTARSITDSKEKRLSGALSGQRSLRNSFKF